MALLLSLYPEAHANIESIVIMGGAMCTGNQTPVAEFNILCDPESAQIVFDSGVKVVLVPLEITHQALATEQVLDAIRSMRSVWCHVHRQN